MHRREDCTSPGGAPSMNADTAAALPVAILWTSDTASIGDFLNRFLRFGGACQVCCVALNFGSGKRESACGF